MDVLRNFIAISEYGSMSRAGKEVGFTQSSLSLQMKKLSELVQSPIFYRHKNGVILTSAGESLLVYARNIVDLNDRAFSALLNDAPTSPIRVGIVQDFSALLVSGALLRFRQIFPDANLRVKVGTTPELHTNFDAGLLDLLVVLGEPNDPGAIGKMQLRWLGHPDLALQIEVPLAVMDAPCPFRDAMIAALDNAGRSYRIVLETPGVAVLGAAINVGLALTCRTSNLPFIDDRSAKNIGVPLNNIAIVMKHTAFASPAILKLNSLVHDALLEFIRAERLD